MADRLVSVDSFTLQFPDAVRAVLALDLVDDTQVEGSALYDAFGRRTVFNPRDYGALFDGSTNDTLALAACFAEAKLAGRSVVVFPVGTTRTNATLDPGGLVIVGYGSTIKPVNGGVGFNVFQASVGFEMHGLTIDLNKANTTNPAATYAGAGVYLYTTGTFSGVLLKDLYVRNGWQVGIGLSTQSSGVTDSRNLLSTPSLIQNCRFENVRFGTFNQNVADVKIVDCHAVDTLADSFWDFMSARSTVRGCTSVRSGGHGIVTQYSVDFIAEGNGIFDPADHGIVAGGGDSPALAPTVNFIISDNTVRSAAVHGITVDTTRAAALTTVVPTYGVIKGNVVEGSGTHGIYLQNAKHGVCSGNILRDNVTSAIGCNSGDWVITGNDMVNNGSAIGHYGADAAHGNNEVANNHRVGNVDYFNSAAAFTKTSLEFTGTGTPEAVVAAPQGSRFYRTDGGASTTLYVKTSGGITNTGWTAK